MGMPVIPEEWLLVMTHATTASGTRCGCSTSSTQSCLLPACLILVHDITIVPYYNVIELTWPSCNNRYRHW